MWIFQEHESGKSAWTIIGGCSISEQTYYQWESKYDGIDVSDAKRLKALEEENRKLKVMVADYLSILKP